MGCIWMILNDAAAFADDDDHADEAQQIQP